MKDNLGFYRLWFYFNTFFMYGVKSLIHSLNLKQRAKHPEIFTSVYCPVRKTWDFKDLKNAHAIMDNNEKRAEKVAARMNKWIKIAEKRNIANATKENLLQCGRGCLKWYECLPIGISYQSAANITGVSFFAGERDNSWERYSPFSEVVKGKMRKSGWS